MRKVLHHLSWLEKAGQNPVQGKEENRQDPVEGGLPQTEVAPESGKESQSRGPFGQPHGQASLGTG